MNSADIALANDAVSVRLRLANLMYQEKLEDNERKLVSGVISRVANGEFELSLESLADETGLTSDECRECLLRQLSTEYRIWQRLPNGKIVHIMQSRLPISILTRTYKDGHEESTVTLLELAQPDGDA